MNRYDKIQAAARAAAGHVCAVPADRDLMADDLIKLVTLIVGAVGKSVAVDGETNIFHGEDEAAHARYITGERIMDGALEVAEAATRVPLYVAEDRIRRSTARQLRPCCYVSPCAPCHCGRPIGGCCYLRSEICPSHG